MSRKETNKKGKDKKNTRKAWAKDFRYGQLVSVSFFRQNAWSLILIVVSVLALMGLKYKTKTRMEQIKKLQVECQRSESMKLQEKAAYMTLIRESEMRRLVNEKGLGLKFQEQPPYELNYTEN